MKPIFISKFLISIFYTILLFVSIPCIGLTYFGLLLDTYKNTTIFQKTFRVISFIIYSCVFVYLINIEIDNIILYTTKFIYIKKGTVLFMRYLCYFVPATLFIVVHTEYNIYTVKQLFGMK